MKTISVTFFVILISFFTLSGCTNRSKIKKSSSSSWIDGLWQGTGYQIDLENDNQWSISLKIDSKRNIYTINYLSIPCRGQWELISISDEQAFFKETIHKGRNLCVNKGKIVLSKIDENTLIYSFFNPGEKKANAFSTLIKN
ncbi:MAG: hypothetical protein ACPGVD_00105 [Flavobacteriales bacterium]